MVWLLLYSPMTSTKPWPYPQPCRLALSGKFHLLWVFSCNLSNNSHVGSINFFSVCHAETVNWHGATSLSLHKPQRKAFLPFFPPTAQTFRMLKYCGVMWQHNTTIQTINSKCKWIMSNFITLYKWSGHKRMHVEFPQTCLVSFVIIHRCFE